MRERTLLRVPASLLALAFGAAMPSGAAMAQPGIERDPAGEPGAPRRVIEEVLVTAQRRVADAQSVPISAAILSGEEMRKKGVDDLIALQYASPGLNISDVGSANVTNIRGLGRSQVDIDLPTGVVLYRDGVPAFSGYFQREPYYDIASVEVLRGPQGTFGGKGASGGAIYLRTNDPELGAMDGYVEGSFGNHKFYEGTAVVNVPLHETVAARIAVNAMSRDDYYDAILGDFQGSPESPELYSVRASLLWEPGALSVLWKNDFNHLDFGGTIGRPPGEELFTAGPFVSGPDVGLGSGRPIFEQTDKSYRSTLTLSYATDGGYTLSSLTGYQAVETSNGLDLQTITLQDFGIPYGTQPTWFQSHADARLYSQELNLISPGDGPIRWVAGLFAQRQEVDAPSFPATGKHGFTFSGNDLIFGFPVPTDFPSVAGMWDNTETEWAVFGQVQGDLTPELSLDVSARYSDYTRKQLTDFLIGPGSSPDYFSFGATDDKLTDRFVDWKAALNWQLTDEHFLYVLASEGNTPAGLNFFIAFGGPDDAEFDTMTVRNYEAGWKATLLEGQMRTQLAAFRQFVDNYQAHLLPLGAGFPFFRSVPGTTKLWGVEAAAQTHFGQLGLDVSAAYLKTEFGDLFDIIDTVAGEIADLRGERLPYAPKWTLAAGAEYAFDLGNGITLTPRVDVSYVDEVKAGLFERANLFVDSRTLVNAQVRMDAGSWWAAAWVRNLTDKEYVGGIQHNGATHYPGAPRLYGLRVGRSFGQ